MKLREKYNNGDEVRMNNEMVWFMFNFLIWIIALCALIYSWKFLDSTAQVIGVVGLLFGSLGSLVTLVAISFSISQLSDRRS